MKIEDYNLFLHKLPPKILLYLYDHRDEDVCSYDIARSLKAIHTYTSVSKILKYFEIMGLVKLKTEGSRKNITLTIKGIEVAKQFKLIMES